MFSNYCEVNSVEMKKYFALIVSAIFILQTLHIPLHLKSMDGKIVSSPTSLVFQPGFPVSRQVFICLKCRRIPRSQFLIFVLLSMIMEFS